MLNIACVWTGNKYDVDYVKNLQSMVYRHLNKSVMFTCLTDRPHMVPYGIKAIDVSGFKLDGWWNKMALFNPSIRGQGRCLYFDLDTVLLHNIDALSEVECDFGICGNFTRDAGNTTWPCHYGSCVMTFADGWGRYVWDRFWLERDEAVRRNRRYGDQMAIQEYVPGATILQKQLGPDYFIGYRSFTDELPSAPVAIFAGSHKPDNSPFSWVKKAWQ